MSKREFLESFAARCREALAAGEKRPRLPDKAVRYKGADLSRANLRGANLNGATFEGADLREADLRETAFGHLEGADLRAADLRKAKQLNLKGADLTDADLREARISGADGAIFKNADLRDADVRLTSFMGADITGAKLGGLVHSGIELMGARVSGQSVKCYQQGRIFLRSFYGGYALAWEALEDHLGGRVLRVGRVQRELEEWEAGSVQIPGVSSQEIAEILRLAKSRFAEG